MYEELHPKSCRNLAVIFQTSPAWHEVWKRPWGRTVSLGPYHSRGLDPNKVTWTSSWGGLSTSIPPKWPVWSDSSIPALLQPRCLPVITRKDPGIPLIDWMIFHGRKPHVHRHRTFLVLFGEVQASYSHVCGVERTALLMQPLVTTIQTQLAVVCAEQMSKFEQPEWTIFPRPYPKWLSKGSQQGWMLSTNQLLLYEKKHFD